MSNSLNIVTGSKRVPTTTVVKRSSLKVGDLFRNRDGGKVYMHTGQRTAPPSGRTVSIQVGNQTVSHEVFKSLGRNAAGQDVIGYQGIVVQGKVAYGQDGSVVTFDGNKDVVLLGTAELSLNLRG